MPSRSGIQGFVLRSYVWLWPSVLVLQLNLFCQVEQKSDSTQKNLQTGRVGGVQVATSITLVAHSLWSKFIRSTTPMYAKLCSSVLFSRDAISDTTRAVSCRSAVSFSTEFTVASAKLIFLGSLHLKKKNSVTWHKDESFFNLHRYCWVCNNKGTFNLSIDTSLRRSIHLERRFEHPKDGQDGNEYQLKKKSSRRFQVLLLCLEWNW